MRKRMLVTVPSLAATAFVTYVVPALAVTDPGQGTAPPTAGAKIDTIVSWVAWLTFAACLVGVLVSAIGLAFDKGGFGGGGGGQGHMKLLWSLGACVVAASASALVGALA
jgi:hypothetical protein